MSCSKFLGTMAALVALSPLSFAQSNSQEKALDEIKQALSELRKENADLKQRLSGLESKPTPSSSLNFERELAELSARFNAVDVGGKEHKGTPLTLTGELRTRGEWYDQTDGTDDFRMLSRLTLSLDWRISDSVKVFAQLRDSRQFGDGTVSELSNGPNTVATDDSSPEFHQVYSWMKDFMGTGLDVKIGRQELVLGSERLVGNNDFNNVGRSFEGFRGDTNWGDLNLTLFMMMVNNTPFDSLYRDRRLYGVWMSTPVMDEQLMWEAYALYYSDDLNDNHLETYGGRIWGKMDIMNYSFEGATQQNHTKDNATKVDFRDAYMFHGDIGFAIEDIDGKPHLGFVYDMGSDLFNNLFADNHARFGESDIFRTYTNYIHSALVLSMEVYDGWQFGTSWHWNRAFKQSGKNDLGQELDFTLKGKCGENVWVTIAAGRNFGDDGQAAFGLAPNYITPSSGDKTITSTFGYVQFTVPF